MSERITEKEIFRVQYDEDGYQSEVLELDLQFSAPTIKGVTELALAAIVDAGSVFQSEDSQAEKDALEDELERVTQGIQDLIERKERVETKLASLMPINGLKAVETLEEQGILEWVMRCLNSKHPMGFKTAAFKLYADLDQGDDINCCVMFYKESRIKKK